MNGLWFVLLFGGAGVLLFSIRYRILAATLAVLLWTIDIIQRYGLEHYAVVWGVTKFYDRAYRIIRWTGNLPNG